MKKLRALARLLHKVKGNIFENIPVLASSFGWKRVQNESSCAASQECLILEYFWVLPIVRLWRLYVMRSWDPGILGSRAPKRKNTKNH